MGRRMTISIKAEIAKSQAELQTGLMGRKRLAENAGMLFDFKEDRPLSFWMSNTYIPLQIAFIRSNGSISQIESMAPLSTRAICSREKCRFALEVNEGWFDKNNVITGATVSFPFSTGQPKQDNASPPQVQVELSHKDIMKKATQLGVIGLVIEWDSKKGTRLKRLIRPPFVFSKTSDGEENGIVTGYDEQMAHYTPIIVDNIISIQDRNNNRISTEEQLKAMSKTQPITREDEALVRGILQ